MISLLAEYTQILITSISLIIFLNIQSYKIFLLNPGFGYIVRKLAFIDSNNQINGNLILHHKYLYRCVCFKWNLSKWMQSL